MPHLGSVSAPHLCAIEDVPVPLALGPGAHADGIRPGPRLTDRQRPDVFTCGNTECCSMGDRQQARKERQHNLPRQQGQGGQHSQVQAA